MPSDDRDNPEGAGPDSEMGSLPSDSEFQAVFRDSESDAGPDEPDHPEQIGSYKILGVLGRGGMGIVYLAEQREPIRRRVALKCMTRTDHKLSMIVPLRTRSSSVHVQLVRLPCA